MAQILEATNQKAPRGPPTHVRNPSPVCVVPELRWRCRFFDWSRSPLSAVGRVHSLQLNSVCVSEPIPFACLVRFGCLDQPRLAGRRRGQHSVSSVSCSIPLSPLAACLLRVNLTLQLQPSATPTTTTTTTTDARSIDNSEDERDRA